MGIAPSSTWVGRKISGNMVSHRVKRKDTHMSEYWVILIELSYNLFVSYCNARTYLMVFIVGIAFGRRLVGWSVSVVWSPHAYVRFAPFFCVYFCFPLFIYLVLFLFSQIFFDFTFFSLFVFFLSSLYFSFLLFLSRFFQIFLVFFSFLSVFFFVTHIFFFWVQNLYFWRTYPLINKD